MALKARDLAVAHGPALGNRVTPTFLASFESDIATLSSDVPDALTAKTGAQQTTAAQNDALLVGRNLVSGVHATVRGQATDKGVRMAYGIGTAVPVRVKQVVSALDTIVARATSQPAEAATFGIIPDDITAFTAADATQEAARASAPVTTKTRNATARRLLAGVQLIAGAGMRVFANDAATRAAFAALK